MITPFFSVVIPTLNEEKFLPNILNDLSTQSEKDFEVIIVDGGSNDATRVIAQRYEKSYPISALNVHKKNVSFQRNYGAARAKGKYIIFIDADSGISLTFIKVLKKNILKRQGLIFLPSIVPKENNSQARPIFKFANFIVEFSQNTIRPFSNGGTMIWERNFFQAIGGFDENLYLAEDHNIIQRANKWGVKAKFIHQIKIKFSLRRMKREGQLVFFYKNIIAATHTFIGGRIKNKIFDYEMGGARYDNLKKKLSFDEKFKSYLLQFNKFFKKYLFES